MRTGFFSHTKSGDPARTACQANYVGTNTECLKTQENMTDCETWWSLLKKFTKKELKRATSYVGETGEKLKAGGKEDLRLAYERICDINKAL